jgi:hypothetical protein
MAAGERSVTLMYPKLFFGGQNRIQTEELTHSAVSCDGKRHAAVIVAISMAAQCFLGNIEDNKTKIFIFQ